MRSPSIRRALIILSLCTVPLAAAEWRVAATSTEGAIAFVDKAGVVRTNDKVTFRFDYRWIKPWSDGRTSMLERVEADCTSRSWTGTSTSVEKNVRRETTMKTTAAPGTVYDAVLTAACTGKFLSDAVENRDRFAAAFFAAAGSTRDRLDIAAGKPPQPPPAPPVPAGDPNTFEHKALRFSLKKPDGWTFVPLAEVKRNSAELQVGDAEVQKFVDEREEFLARNSVTKLVSVQKRGFTLAQSYPIVEVSVRPLEPDLPNPSPKSVVHETLEGVRKAFPDLVVDAPVREFTMAGHPAADYVATYTIRTKDGRVIPTRNRLIVVVSGAYVYFVATGHPPPGDAQLTAELETILSSITMGR